MYVHRQRAYISGKSQIPMLQVIYVSLYICIMIYDICITRHTHSVNASCSYEVHEDIICIHTNGSLEDVALL